MLLYKSSYNFWMFVVWSMQLSTGDYSLIIFKKEKVSIEKCSKYLSYT